MPVRGYDQTFHSTDRDEARRLHALAAAYDGMTHRLLIPRLTGSAARCIDVGAGVGTVAAWLASRGCTVTALDRDAGLLHASEHAFAVVEADVCADAYRPGPIFDLVFTRFLLMHLSAREAVLDRLLSWVKPGGWLVVIDGFDVSSPLSGDPDWLATITAFWAAAQGVLGTDTAWVRRYPEPLLRRGLHEVGQRTDLWEVRGGTPQATFFQLTIPTFRSRMLASRQVTAEQLDRVARALDDPAFAEFGIGLSSAWGRRPLSGDCVDAQDAAEQA